MYIIFVLNVIIGFLRINVTNLVKRYPISKKEEKDKINNIIRIVRLWITLEFSQIICVFDKSLVACNKNRKVILIY